MDQRLQIPKSVNIQQLLFIGEHVFKKHRTMTPPSPPPPTPPSVAAAAAAADDMAAYVSGFVSVVHSIEFIIREQNSEQNSFVDRSKRLNATPEVL